MFQSQESGGALELPLLPPVVGFQSLVEGSFSMQLELLLSVGSLLRIYDYTARRFSNLGGLPCYAGKWDSSCIMLLLVYSLEVLAFLRSRTARVHIVEITYTRSEEVDGA